jgi:ankyrin repeat protein
MYDKLIKACETGDLKKVKSLVSRGVNIHSHNDAALYCAAEYGHLNVVQYLIEQGSKGFDKLDDYILPRSAEKGHFEIVKFLVEQGADIHSNNDYALRWAASNGHFEIVKFLVESGADIHAENDFAIRWAELSGHNEILKYLKLVKNLQKIQL